MESFDLRGRTVGERLMKAIRRTASSEPIALNCSGATFVAPVSLRGAHLVEADFADAVFERGARFERVTIESEARFDRVNGRGLLLREVDFRGTTTMHELRVPSLVVKDCRFRRYASFDGAILREVSFRDVHFAAEARFRGLECSGAVTLRSIRFEGAASFQAARVEQLSFPNCRFEGPLQIGKRELRNRDPGKCLLLTGSRFAQASVVTADVSVLDAEDACFEQGADLLLAPGCVARLEGTSFLGPSSIGTMGGADKGRGRILSLDRARVDHLTLRDLDLSECSFAGLHRLDDVLIVGRGQLAVAPDVIEGAYRREVLVDEAIRRCNGRGGMLGWAPVTWERPAALAKSSPLDPNAIAAIYRAMRKSREESHDYPGAADFYYGEMEMRREGADTHAERAILTLYWLVSGYGLRASRAILTYLAVVLLLAAGFHTIGFENPADFAHTLAWTLTATISLTRPVEHMDLTSIGAFLNVAARISGPAMVTLIALSLRSRVRR